MKEKKIELSGGTFDQKIIKVLRNNSQEPLVRKESNFFNQNLIKEIKFLNSLKNGISQHFPIILDYQINKLPIFYEMPFYNLKTMSENILNSNHPPEYYIEITKNILKFAFREIYSKNVEKNKEDYLSKTVFSRIDNRYLNIKNHSPIMKKFIEPNRLVIEGIKYKNIPELILYLKKNKSLLQKLIPKKTHMIHGDFHFDNFLVDDKNVNNFILIDPRGEINKYCYNYDIGKLWFSIHGKYDLLREGLFDLEYEVKGKEIIVGSFKFKNTKPLKTLEEINNKKNYFIDICNRSLSEENIKSQILFSEAIHFCAIAPFNLKKDGIEKETIGRYLTGVKLLNEFINGL